MLGSVRHWRKKCQLIPSTSCRSCSRNSLDAVEQIVEYHGIWGAVKTFPRRRPFITNLLLSTSLMPAADFSVQFKEGQRWDAQRSCCFCLFGLYVGAAYWFVYISIFRRLFPNAIRFSNLSFADKLRDSAGQRALIGQVACDLLLYVPFFYFPVFYTFKALLAGESVVAAWKVFWQNFYQDNFASIAFWVPGDIICFTVPAWLRLPTSHAISFSWNSLLSWLRGACSMKTESSVAVTIAYTDEPESLKSKSASSAKA